MQSINDRQPDYPTREGLWLDAGELEAALDKGAVDKFFQVFER